MSGTRSFADFKCMQLLQVMYESDQIGVPLADNHVKRPLECSINWVLMYAGLPVDQQLTVVRALKAHYPTVEFDPSSFCIDLNTMIAVNFSALIKQYSKEHFERTRTSITCSYRIKSAVLHAEYLNNIRENWPAPRVETIESMVELDATLDVEIQVATRLKIAYDWVVGTEAFGEAGAIKTRYLVFPGSRKSKQQYYQTKSGQLVVGVSTESRDNGISYSDAYSRKKTEVFIFPKGVELCDPKSLTIMPIATLSLKALKAASDASSLYWSGGLPKIPEFQAYVLPCDKQEFSGDDRAGIYEAFLRAPLYADIAPILVKFESSAYLNTKGVGAQYKEIVMGLGGVEFSGERPVPCGPVISAYTMVLYGRDSQMTAQLFKPFSKLNPHINAPDGLDAFESKRDETPRVAAARAAGIARVDRSVEPPLPRAATSLPFMPPVMDAAGAGRASPESATSTTALHPDE